MGSDWRLDRLRAASVATATGAATATGVAGSIGATNATAGATAAGCSVSPNAALTSPDLRYQRINAGRIAIEKATPVPGNWKKARAASNRAKPAMNIANQRAQGCSAHRPPAARSQTMPVAIASQPHSPTWSKAGRSPSAPNQSKPTTRSPKNRKPNPASAAKNPRIAMRIGGFFTRVPPHVTICGYGRGQREPLSPNMTLQRR